MTDLILLAPLLDGPRHGYQLKKEAGLAQGQAELHNNLVYPLLRRFAARGWVRQREIPGERGQMRRLYTLTSAGKAELARRLAAFSGRDAQSSGAFQLRASLFAILDPASRQRILAAREEFLAKREESLCRTLQHFRPAQFPAEVIRFRLR